MTPGELAMERNDIPAIIEAEFGCKLNGRMTKPDRGFQDHVKYLAVMLYEKWELFLNQICFTKGETELLRAMIYEVTHA